MCGKEKRGSGWMVGKPYLGITSRLPVIRPELGRTIQSRIKSNFSQRDFWPAPKSRSQVSQPLCRNQRVLSGYGVIPAQSPTRGASLENLDLGVKRRRNLSRETPVSLRYASKKLCTQYAVTASWRRPSIPSNAEHTEHPQHDMALQQGSVVAEGEMVRATDRYA